MAVSPDFTQTRMASSRCSLTEYFCSCMAILCWCLRSPLLHPHPFCKVLPYLAIIVFAVASGKRSDVGDVAFNWTFDGPGVVGTGTVIYDTVFLEGAVDIAVVGYGVVHDSTGDGAVGHFLDGAEVRR